jgi:hypothetical protein
VAKLEAWRDKSTWLSRIEISASGYFSDMIRRSCMLVVEMSWYSRFNTSHQPIQDFWELGMTTLTFHSMVAGGSRGDIRSCHGCHWQPGEGWGILTELVDEMLIKTKYVR